MGSGPTAFKTAEPRILLHKVHKQHIHPLLSLTCGLGGLQLREKKFQKSRWRQRLSTKDLFHSEFEMVFRSHDAHSTAAFVLLFATESGLNVPFLPFPILNFLSLPLASFPNGNGSLSERFRERQPFRAQVERFPKFIAPHASTQERRCKK